MNCLNSMGKVLKHFIFLVILKLSRMSSSGGAYRMRQVRGTADVNCMIDM
uniref:Uncharacterized protein n=1 Tax=Arundo donax TaxID=35708 RepID=A0A0A8YC24_ARUDO